MSLHGLPAIFFKQMASRPLIGLLSISSQKMKPPEIFNTDLDLRLWINNVNKNIYTLTKSQVKLI